MKKINYITKLLIVTCLSLFFFPSCENEDAITIGITDMNKNIMLVDKDLVEPGDVVTFTGTGLDKVYKIMFNNDNTPISFVATKTELKVTVPASSPFGDVITVNILFSGNGLAQRAISVQSPPVILHFTPAAGQPGTVVRVLGRELYKYSQVFIGSQEVTSSVTLISDLEFRVTVPAGSTGGDIKIISKAGGQSLSPRPFALGQEIMINDFDGTTQYFTSTSNNGNIGPVVTVAGDFLRGNFLQLPIVDRASSWGGNFDVYLTGLPTDLDITKISFSIDIKASKGMNVNLMIQNAVNVYGQTRAVTVDWQTIVMPLTTLLEGYGSNGPAFAAGFNTLSAVKIQPPATTANANFGESVSIDNVKFIVSQ